MKGKKVALAVAKMFIGSLAQSNFWPMIQLVSNDKKKVVEYLKNDVRKMLKGNATFECAGKECNGIGTDPCYDSCFCPPIGIVIIVCIGD